MTERAREFESRFDDDSRLLERQWENSRFVFMLQNKLISIQKSRENEEDIEVIMAKAKDASSYIETNWPNSVRLAITLPEDAQIYDYNDQLVHEGYGTFTADNFGGIDHVGVRFLNLGTGHWARFGNVLGAVIEARGPAQRTYE